MRIKLRGASLLAWVCFLWLGQWGTSGAVGIGPAGKFLTFDTVPSAGEFATAAVAGGGANFTSPEALDAAVAATDAKLITNGLTLSATVPPSTSTAGFRYNTTWQALQSRPAGVASVMMKMTLRNETGTELHALPFSYDFGVQSAFPGELPGHYVYWSFTGEPGSWTRIDSLSGNGTPGRLGAILPLQAWQPNAELYLLWVDDNADAGTDPSYTIDNLFFGIEDGFLTGISVPAGGTSVLTFESVPTNAEWSTLYITGLASEITMAAELDARVQLLEAATVNQTLRISSAVPPSGNNIAKWSSTLQTLVTRPNGCAFHLLMGTLRNDTARSLDSVRVFYTLADVLPAGATNAEEVVGHRVFFSLTGASNSWQLIPEFSTGATGALSATLQLGTWAPNQKLYLLWADDNSNADANNIGNDEGAYTIDNFQVQPPISLRARRLTSATMLELTWPYPSEGFQLQSKSSLGATWEPVVAQDFPGGGWHRVVAGVGNEAMFYRLNYVR